MYEFHLHDSGQSVSIILPNVNCYNEREALYLFWVESRLATRVLHTDFKYYSIYLVLKHETSRVDSSGYTWWWWWWWWRRLRAV
jgi:hypothetical protein